MRNRTRTGIRRTAPKTTPATPARAIVEPLEPRRLLAAISGNVFLDTNNSFVQEPGEVGAASRLVYIDSNDNGLRDAGEPFRIADANGVYAFTGLDAGTYALRQEIPGGSSQTFPRVDGAPASKFNIDFDFADTNQVVAIGGVKVNIADVFQAAARRWEQVIVADIPNDVSTMFPNPDGTPRPVDDLLISASVVPIDGPGGILGQARPDEFRTPPADPATDPNAPPADPNNPNAPQGLGIPSREFRLNSLPISGEMQFDIDDLADSTPDSFFRTVLHEMGHVLGFGTLWEDFNLVSPDFNTLDYLGPAAIDQYKQVFDVRARLGLPDNFIPYENALGPGSDRSHWRETVFGNELESPLAEDPTDPSAPGFNVVTTSPGFSSPLSRVTTASMEDLGYTVYNPSADFFAPPNGDGALAPGFYGQKPVMDPFAYTVSVSQNEKQRSVNFGVRANAAPRNVAVRTPIFAPGLTPAAADAFNAATAAAEADTTGQTAAPTPVNTVTLQALGVADVDGGVYAVNFYRESNGRRGLQTSGPNPDSYIAQDTTSRGGWKASTATDGLAPGDYTFYARAFDNNLKFTDSVGVVSIVPAVTAAPPKVSNLAVTPLSQNAIRIQYADLGTPRGANQEIGFRVEVSTSQTFRTKNVYNYGPDVNDVTIDGLAPGTTYYVRVRASNAIGTAPFSATNFTTTFVPGEIVLDNPSRTGTVVRTAESEAGVVKARGAWKSFTNSPEARLDTYLEALPSDGTPATLADAIYQPNLAAGRYFVYATWSPQRGNSRSVPIDIFDRDGTHGFKTVTVDQTVGSKSIYSDVPQALGGDQLLGAFDFAAGPAGFVRVRNYGLDPDGFGPLLTPTGTRDIGRVTTDSIRFVPATGAALASAQSAARPSARPSSLRLTPTPPARTAPFAAGALITFDPKLPTDPEDPEAKAVLA